MRVAFILLVIVAAMDDLTCFAVFPVKRSVDHLIGSTNLGATATFGERGVSDCLALGNPLWKCYSEQMGINPQCFSEHTYLPMLHYLLWLGDRLDFVKFKTNDIINLR